MHIKRIHEMEEKLTEIAICEMGKGLDCVNTEEMGAVIDMIKDLACAEKYAREAKEIQKEEDKDKEDEKYFIKMLKEEYGMEDEEEARRYYRGQPRSKTSGRFISRGDGRRSYTTPYYHLPPYMRYETDPEYYRDMDREMGRMYYPSKKTRFNDGTSTRYEMAKRNYTETKELHSANTAEDKQAKMSSLEKYMTELGSDISEMISDASNEEKTLLKNKLQVLAQKVI